MRGTFPGVNFACHLACQLGMLRLLEDCMFLVCQTERGYSPVHFLGISLYVREMRRMTIGAIMRRFSVGKWEVWAIRFGAGWPSKILFRGGSLTQGACANQWPKMS